MYHTFFHTICKVGIFLICAQAILHFRPKEVYEKYMKLLVSAMVLIQLILPLGSFLLGGRKEEMAQALEQFKQNMEQAVRQAEENSAAADALLEQMTLEEVRKAAEAKEQQGEYNTLQEDAGEDPEKGGAGGEMGQTKIEIEVEVETVEPVRMGGEDS